MHNPDYFVGLYLLTQVEFQNVTVCYESLLCFVENKSLMCFSKCSKSIFWQSGAWKVSDWKVKSIFLSHPGDSHPVLYVVCQPDIPAKSPSTRHRWRGWSWSDNISCNLPFSPAWLVCLVDEPKRLQWSIGWTATLIMSDMVVCFATHFCRIPFWQQSSPLHVVNILISNGLIARHICITL